MSALVVTKAPCAKCPFRKDVPIYLHQARRAEIAATLINGGGFDCHATVDYSNEDEHGDVVPDSGDASLCAGAMASLAQSGGSNQMVRIAARLGMLDSEAHPEMPEIVWSLTEWVRLAEGATVEDPDEIEGETCSVVNSGCEAPAGYIGSGGGVVEGTEYVDTWCFSCGEPVCDSCLATCEPDPVCANCAEEDE